MRDHIYCEQSSAKPNDSVLFSIHLRCLVKNIVKVKQGLISQQRLSGGGVTLLACPPFCITQPYYAPHAYRIETTKFRIQHSQ